MSVHHVFALTLENLMVSPSVLLGFECSLWASLVSGIGLLFAAAIGAESLTSGGFRLKNTANRIHSRMVFLKLNETELSEQCSLAAIHIFEHSDPPLLTRDRVSKILMNRQDAPAKSAARIISHAELTVLD